MQALKLADAQAQEAVERVRRVGEKIQPGGWVAAYCDGAIVDTVVDPVAADLEAIGQLGHGQVTRNASWVGLAALLHELMAQADPFHCAGQQVVAHRRAVPFGRQCGGDLVVRHGVAGHFQDASLHLGGSGQTAQITDRNFDLPLAGRPAAPDDADLDAIGGAAVGDHLVDQAAQQRLAALVAECRILP
mgnify:CR=1 FL=1